MNMMKMCMNPKVLIGLAAVAVGLFLFAPQVALSALPVLILLACPLSMGLMALMMGRKTQSGATTAAPGQYTCPMHPHVAASSPGPCPMCGMDLVATALPSRAAATQPRTSGEVTSREARLAELKEQFQQIQEEQQVIARKIAELDQSRQGKEAEVVREAEQVARKADERTEGG